MYNQRMRKVTLYTLLYTICCLAGPQIALAEDEQAEKRIKVHHVFVDWVEDGPNINVCNGHYVLPEFLQEQRPETIISADSTFLLHSGESTLTGNVLIEEPDQRLFADEVVLVRNDDGEIESAQAIGGVVLEQPEFRLFGDKAENIFANNATTVWDAEYRWYPRNARGFADMATTADDEPIYLYNASYTTCAPDSNLWMLKASKVVLNEETGRGETWHTKMYLKDVPIMYLPYFNFPIDDRRKTGFLDPSYGTSSRRGQEITAPFYLNLAPNYDATLFPHYMSERGLQMGLQQRYMNEIFYSEFNGQYINHDRKFASFRKDKLASNQHPNPNDPRRENLEDATDDRWLVNYNLYGHHGSNWRTHLEFNEVSDDEYFIDFGSNDFGLDERFLRRRAEANYAGNELTAAVMVQDYQTLQPFESGLVQEPYQIMPHVETFYMPYYPEQAFELTNLAMATSFAGADNVATGERRTDGQRYHLQPTLSFPQRRSYGFFIPSVTLYETYYDLNLSRTDKDLGNDADINRTIPSISVDSGLIFERDLMYFNKAYIQTLEPRLFYLYTPFHNQNEIPNFDTTTYQFTTSQLFRKNRFAGIDRIGDANQLSYAVTSRFYETTNGAERFRGTVGQIYYFEDREVMLCNTDLNPNCFLNENPGAKERTSSVVGDAIYRFSPRWSLSADGRFDHRNTNTDLAAGRFQYRKDDRNLMHVGMRYEQSGNLANGGDSSNDLIQSDIGFSIGLDQHLTLLGRWYYDLRNDFSVDMFGGLEYEGCCFAIRAGARRYLRQNAGTAADRVFDNEYFVQWVFKGLGNVGSSHASYATQYIPGYRDRFDVDY
jgi:LPS-assembly protein